VKEVVRPELIIVAMLSSPMFAMGWGCYWLGGDTTVPSGLYARLCHAFLV